MAANPSEAAPVTVLDLSELSALGSPLAPVQPELLAIAYCLVLAGFLTSVWQHKDSPEPGLEPLLRCAIAVATISMLPWLSDLATTVFYYVPAKLAEANGGINSAGNAILRVVVGTAGRAVHMDASSTAGVVHSLFSGAGYVLGFLASFVVVLFYIIQHIAEQVCFGFMSIALALQTIPALRSRATAFVLGTLSVLAWPTGFAVATFTANAALRIGGAPETSGTVLALLAPTIASGVLVVATCATPLLCYILFTAGGSAGSGPANATAVASSRMWASIARTVSGGSTR